MSKIQKIRMRFRSYDYRVLDRVIRDVVEKVVRVGAKVAGPIPCPNRLKKMTVLRSPHIDKKARDQFELCRYKRFLDIECNAQALEVLVSLNVASEVAVEIETQN